LVQAKELCYILAGRKGRRCINENPGFNLPFHFIF